jgi:MFS family permease
VPLLIASLVLASIPVGYLNVVLPLYLNRAGLEPSLIGLLYTLSGLVTAGLVGFSGALADRFGRTHFLIAGTALPIASYAIFSTTTDTPWLVAASLLGGVGMANGAAGALTAASFDALLAGYTPLERRTAVFAGAQAAWSIALGVGSLFAAAPDWLRQTPLFGQGLDAYRPPFIVLIGLTVVATAILLPLHETTHTSSDPAKRSWLPKRSVGPIARYSLALALFGLGLGVAVQLLPLWLNLRFGVDEAALAPWFAAGQVLGLTSVAFAPWLDRRLGASLGVMLVQLIGGLCLVCIAFVAPDLRSRRTRLRHSKRQRQRRLADAAVGAHDRGRARGAGDRLRCELRGVGCLQRGRPRAGRLADAKRLAGTADCARRDWLYRRRRGVRDRLQTMTSSDCRRGSRAGTYAAQA